MSDQIAVRFRDCECPGHPHNGTGDLAYLAPKLPYQGGLEARGNVLEALGNPKFLAELWLVTFVKHGVTGWNLLDEDGEPVNLDINTILADYDYAAPIGDKADELYGDTVSRPLVQRLRKLSPRGPKASSTSQSSGSTPSRQRRSSRATSAASKRSRR